jgi:hypothetical protein
MRSPREALLGLFVISSLAAPVLAQTAIVVDFPDPASFYQNSTFAIDGDVAYVPSFDNDTFWSFSLETGELLDPDGLPLPTPGTASDPFVFAGSLVAVPGWFPGQGVFVADVSDPANLAQAGIIDFPPTTNIQGQNVEVDDDGVTGYVAGFPDDKLYSFNVQTLSLTDPDGVSVPGDLDRIGLGDDRVAIADWRDGRIMVVDVSDPANLAYVGVIDLPEPSSFNSNDNIVFADDGRTGFVTTEQCYLYAFDVMDLRLRDPDGVYIGGATQFGGHVAIHGSTVACLYGRGLTFVDASDPTNLTVISQADFGGTVAPQGSATVAFTADGTRAAMPVIYPGNLVYTFDVATGAQVAPPFAVDSQPNYLTIFGPDNRVGTLISGTDAKVWLISGLFGTVEGDIDGDGDVDLADLAALLAAYDTCEGDAGYNPDADLDGSGCVDLSDLATLLANYGYGT